MFPKTSHSFGTLTTYHTRCVFSLALNFPEFLSEKMVKPKIIDRPSFATDVLITLQKSPETSTRSCMFPLLPSQQYHLVCRVILLEFETENHIIDESKYFFFTRELTRPSRKRQTKDFVVKKKRSELHYASKTQSTNSLQFLDG